MTSGGAWYRTTVLSCLTVGVLWPNRLTDQYETWHAGRPQPRRHCVRWVASYAPKGTIFGRCPLWPNSWMD